jgi:uncharacterized protein
MLRKLLIGVVKCYQRFISPHKGFRCAYAVYHQTDSCSVAAINILQQNQNISESIQDIRSRLESCRQANVALQILKEKEKQRKSNSCSNSLQSVDCIGNACSCVDGCNVGDACSFEACSCS